MSLLFYCKVLLQKKLFLKRLVQVNKRLLKFFENTMNVTTVLEEKMVLFNPSAKVLERERSISPSSFYGQLPDYQSHVFSLIYPVGKSLPSRKWRRGVSPRFHLIVLYLVKVKRIRKGEFRILVCNPSGGNLVFMSRMPELRSDCQSHVLALSTRWMSSPSRE